MNSHQGKLPRISTSHSHFSNDEDDYAEAVPYNSSAYGDFRLLFAARLFSLSSLYKPQTESYKTIYHRNPACSAQFKTQKTSSVAIDRHVDRSKYLCMKQYNESPGLLSQTYADNELSFNSHFECGNLLKVYKKNRSEYILLLSYDTETQDYAHWYYFSTQNTFKGNIRFHIINMMREEPLVLEGMQPVVWSENRNLKDGSEWTRGGTEIVFTETSQFESCLKDDGELYHTLAFTYEYTEANDTVYFAYSYPYSYTMLKDLVCRVSRYRKLVKVEELTKTLAGNVCKFLVITDHVEKNYVGKRAIVLTARVHPGETSSSYCIEGLLEFLVSENPEAVLLRKFYVFYIVPMLNPDGVRHGNYRCSLLGVDLNRRWAAPSKTYHPTIYFTKRLVKSIIGKLEIAVYCDFHGHSKKKNVFMYGCHTVNKEESVQRDNLVSMIIPTLMSQFTSSFSLDDTHYKIEKAKETTARVVFYREAKISNSYTLETSFLGDCASIKQFTTEDYKNIGKWFSVALLGITRNAIGRSIEMVHTVNASGNKKIEGTLDHTKSQYAITLPKSIEREERTSNSLQRQAKLGESKVKAKQTSKAQIDATAKHQSSGLVPKQGLSQSFSNPRMSNTRTQDPQISSVVTKKLAMAQSTTKLIKRSQGIRNLRVPQQRHRLPSLSNANN